jgi:hypothetical protein
MREAKDARVTASFFLPAHHFLLDSRAERRHGGARFAYVFIPSGGNYEQL